jgi:transcriptional regulator with XRE-family HTH domain
LTPVNDKSTPEAMFGIRLRAFRRVRGWSQAELAEEMKGAGFNWRQTTVAKAEAAERPLRLNEAMEVAATFGMTLTEFLDSTDDEVTQARINLLHANMKLDQALEREAQIRAELALAEETTRTWQHHREVAVTEFEGLREIVREFEVGATRGQEDDDEHKEAP